MLSRRASKAPTGCERERFTSTSSSGSYTTVTRLITAPLTVDPRDEATDYESGANDGRDDVPGGDTDGQRRETGKNQGGGSVLPAKKDRMNIAAPFDWLVGVHG